ncbi:hypothetical protein DFH27DRAFT_655892 [Peziza echinospora]|nr:hypothetical protein DFH27DRAFT_655892 [Peziza echinospora]
MPTVTKNTSPTSPTTTLPVPPIRHPKNSSTSIASAASTTVAPPPPPTLILIAGAPCSGKKTVLAALRSKLEALSKLHNIPILTSTLHQSDFHVELTEQEIVSGGVGKVGGARDMECLKEFEMGLLGDVVEGLGREGGGVGGVRAPRWDGRRRGWGEVVVESLGRGGAEVGGKEKEGGKPVVPDVVLVEGQYLLCDQRLLESATVKIFVECDPDVRLARRVLRDSTQATTVPSPTSSSPQTPTTTKPALSLDYIFDQHIRFSKPSSEIVIQPTKVLADIILPRGAEGPGVELIANGVVDDLRDGRGRLRGEKGGERGGERGGTTLLESGAGGYYEMV